MEKNKKKITRGDVIKIIQAVLCAAYVIFMSAQAICIYAAGSAARAADPGVPVYTRGIAAEALMKGLPLLIAAVAVTMTAAVMGVRNTEKPVTDPAVLRDRIAARIKAPTAEMTAERAKQRKIMICGRIFFALSMLPILLYMTNAKHFEATGGEGLESVVTSMVLFILPWTVIGTGALSIAYIRTDKSIRRETALAADCEEIHTEVNSADIASRTKTVIAVRCAVLVLSLAFIAMGMLNGGAGAVLSKAITICTECIGLG